MRAFAEAGEKDGQKKGEGERDGAKPKHIPVSTGAI